MQPERSQLIFLHEAHSEANDRFQTKADIGFSRHRSTTQIENKWIARASSLIEVEGALARPNHQHFELFFRRPLPDKRQTLACNTRVPHIGQSVARERTISSWREALRGFPELVRDLSRLAYALHPGVSKALQCLRMSAAPAYQKRELQLFVPP